MPAHASRADPPQTTVSVLLRTGDPMPLGPGNFKNLSVPAIDQGFIAFEGTSTTDPTYRSIFRSNGVSIARMAETFTTMPGGGAALFSAFGWGSEAGQLSVDGVFVTFVGRDVPGASPGSLEGIYTSFTPLPAMVFDSTPAGGGYINFGLYGEPSRDGALVATDCYAKEADGTIELVTCSDDATGCSGRSEASWISRYQVTYLVRLGGGPTGPSRGEGLLLVGCSPPFDLGVADGDSPTLPLPIVTAAEVNWRTVITLPPFSYGPSPRV